MFKILKIEQYLFANISYLNISQITLGPPVIWVLSLVQAIVISFLYQMIFDNQEILLWTNSSGHKSVQENLYLNATIAKDFGEDGLGQHCEGCQHNCNSLCKRDSRWKYCFFFHFLSEKCECEWRTWRRRWLIDLVQTHCIFSPRRQLTVFFVFTVGAIGDGVASDIEEEEEIYNWYYVCNTHAKSGRYLRYISANFFGFSAKF